MNGGSAEGGYSQPGSIVQDQVNPGQELPFTGFDVAPIVALAVFLTAIGYALRKVVTA